jgi:DNA-directed RNA polymerase specialized sigma24 family protein
MTVDTEERNAVFLEYERLLNWTVKRNYGLLGKLRINAEDMYQALAITLLKAIESYDPGRGTKPATYFVSMLQYGVLKLHREGKRACRIANLTARPLAFVNDDGEETGIDIPYNEDFDGGLCLNEFLAGLSERERGVIDIKMNGGKITDKRQKVWFNSAKRKAARACAMGGL